MDRERLGRVLGKGARLAARTAIEAVDAATADSPAQTPVTRHVTRRGDSSQPTGTILLSSDHAPSRLRPAVKAAQSSVLTPLRRASRELWHELTGSFFALFAFGFAVAVWHTRANAWSAVVTDRYRFGVMCAVTLLFAYFSVSSFARARRRPLR